MEENRNETWFSHQRWIKRWYINEYPFQRSFLQSIRELRRYRRGYLFWHCTGCPHIRDVSSLSEKEVRNCFQESIEKDRRISAENRRSFYNAYNRLTVLISFFRYQMLCANSSPLYSKMDKKIISEKSRLIEYVVQLIPDTMQWLTI